MSQYLQIMLMYMVGQVNDASNIIFFDGVCNLCNGVVKWVIKNDKKSKANKKICEEIVRPSKENGEKR